MAGDDKKRIKELEEIIEVILLAVPREIAAHEFYKNAGRKASNDAVRQMFEWLAMQEKGHEMELKRILDDMKSELISLKTVR